MFAVGYLVSFGMASPKRIVEEAKKMESYGAQYVNLAESQGYLVPSQVKEYVYALREALSIPVGFHGHNNLGLAIGNSMAALDAGATYVDGSLKSLGGGAGNTQSETLIAALKRGGFETKVDLFGILDAASVLEDEIKNHPNLAKHPKARCRQRCHPDGLCMCLWWVHHAHKTRSPGIRLRPAAARASPGRTQGRGHTGRRRHRGGPAPRRYCLRSSVIPSPTARRAS